MKVLFLVPVCAAVVFAAPRFTASATVVETQDFVEVTVETQAMSGNPFLAARLEGELRREGKAAVEVGGFCDSTDGSLFL